MSANGVFSSTLDYEFFGGGVVNVTGEVSASLEPILDFSAKALIFAESSNNHLDFTFSGGIQLPIIEATADLQIDFYATSSVEFGIQSYLFANTRIEYTVSSEAFSVVSGDIDVTVPFTVETQVTQFSLGQGNVSYTFDLQSLSINDSTHIYDRFGENGVSFGTIESNSIQLTHDTNDITLVNAGETRVEIIRPT